MTAPKLLFFLFFVANLSGCAGGGGKTIDPELLLEVVLEETWKDLKSMSFFLAPVALFYLYRIVDFIRSWWKS